MPGIKKNQIKQSIRIIISEEILSYMNLVPNPRILRRLSGGQDVCSRLLPRLQFGTDLRLGAGGGLVLRWLSGRLADFAGRGLIRRHDGDTSTCFPFS